MIQYPETNNALREKFERVVEWPTMHFKDQNMETKYHEKRIKELAFSRSFKYSLLMLILVVIFRRIELLAFAWGDIKSVGVGTDVEYIMISLLIVALIFELFFALVAALNKFKGFLLMVYLFGMVCYTSWKYIDFKPSSVPMYSSMRLTASRRGIPVYIGAILIGKVYVYTWMAAGLASMVGMGMHIGFNHLYNFPICTSGLRLGF